MARRFINIQDLHHLGTVIAKVDGRMMFRNQYAADIEVTSLDIFYRPGTVRGSYIFYELFHLDIKTVAQRFPDGSPLKDKYHLRVEQHKIDKREDIRELRLQLHDSFAAQT